MSDATDTRATILVRGRVQGVGYRAFVRRHALDLGLAGHAENLSDGRVEVVLEGDRGEVEHALVALAQGPAHAVVDDLEVHWSAPAGLRGFHVV